MKAMTTALYAIRPNPASVRTHDARNIKAIVDSLDRFGQIKPIVTDCDGVIIAGNATYLAAKWLGWETIVTVVADLAGPDVKAYSVADNRTAELAAWNDPALLSLLQELEAEDAALFAATGFDDDDMKRLLDESLPDEMPLGIDDVPAAPDEAITKPGDLWILGDHRLLCGDSAAATDLDRLLDGAKIQLVNTDPPYNVNVEPRSNNALAAAGKKLMPNQSFDVARQGAKIATTKKLRAKDRPLVNDFVSDKEFARLLRAWFGQITRVLEPGRSFYIWGGYANVANYPSALVESELRFSQAIIWVKGHPVLTRKDFMGDHEWCFYGWRAGAAHWFNPRFTNARDVWRVEHASTNKTPLLSTEPTELPARCNAHAQDERETVFDIKIDGVCDLRLIRRGGRRPADVWTVKKVASQKMVHLTEKPVELAVRAMRYSSRPGENVLDLFGGSGSTLIAAEHAKRRAFLMEIDSLYCDVIVERWEKMTGRKAERK